MRRALAFLTPFGGAAAPDATTLSWFPVVGALIGLVLGGFWWLVAKAWSPLPAAALVVVADLALTGLLHFDGLADAGDGLLAPMVRERRLAAMADPAVGAFGVVTVVVVLLCRVGALSALRPAPLVLAGLWCTSRTAMAFIASTLAYARPDGIVRDFLGVDGHQRTWRTVLTSLLGLALSVVLVCLGRGTRGLAALGAELGGVAAVAWLAQRRLGGYTGDVLGAAGVIGETIGLLVWATR